MALVFTPKRSFCIGDRLMLIVDITGDNSYPTNGTVVNPVTAFGMTELDCVEPQRPTTGIRVYQYDYANNKLKVFSAFNTEVTNATDCSADIVRTVVTGKGYPTTGV